MWGIKYEATHALKWKLKINESVMSH